ncbi:inositol-pentakisphosphate 2-kinase [Vararia minispora EC-137]|uniref:Inositol-pentakisphosphate 2-kinase n=1 Tax=Vararia minispora EC-137 TaxID=1314806 RepID=A0ACB8QMF0_9AGAM|nr:inositol-pentakisphosphate 2-kinase [Vararia minispora EC-137]
MTTSVPSPVNTEPSDWAYVNEGRAAIVFSYHGPSDPLFNRKVLRFRKSTSSHPSTIEPDADQPDDPIISFQQVVLARLIDSQYLINLDVVALDPGWLSAFAAHHDSLRPREHRAVSRIDLTYRKAVLADDLVGPFACAIEIKPKWGFLPSPTHLSPKTAEIKTRTCRTCMHDYLRRTQSSVTSSPPIAYCALDLFARDPARVRRAVGGLWDTWIASAGHGNKLRVFARGTALSPDDHTAVAACVANVLGTAPNASLDDIRAPFCETVAHTLLDTAVLPHLAELQRQLDVLDIEGLAALRARTPEPDFPEPTLEDWRAFLDDFLASHSMLDHEHPDPARFFYYVRAFMLSATLKDCSLFVCLADPPIIKLVDLDPKSVRKFQYWKEMDDEIVSAYAQVDPEKRAVCVGGSTGC